ncbi:hypothetical protein C7405_101635 [Paraburkholderia caballeronis]|uniref:beta strand repeat-containing protein n=1 Tax=Paraburkholderia caballeronis TaxID=416943 RepID=UPI0010DAF784|nr:hypothetical protein [Paraburkholderia caballeronis]TDV39516.1 hypothetical protein C7405_101635 [Paraburkholderia caballeronis]
MAIENDFLPFATAAGANVLDQSDYANLPALSTGFQAGTALSAQLNKVWRQSSIMSAVLAQFIVAQSGNPAIDDGTTATLLANLKTAILATTRTTQGSFNALNSYSASTTLQASANGSLNVSGTSGITLTLPLASSVPNGALIAFANLSGINSWSIACQGSDTIHIGTSTITSTTMNPLDTVILSKTLSSGWTLIGINALQYAPIAVGAATAAAHAVQLQQMESAQGSYSGVVSPANGAVIDSTYLGKFVLAGGSFSYTLAALSTFDLGDTLTFSNTSSAQGPTISTTGSDAFNLGSATNVNSFVLQPGQTVSFTKVSASAWRPMGMSTAAIIALPVAPATGPTHAVQLSQLTAAWGSLRTSQVIAANTTLTVADIGSAIACNTNGVQITLPVLSTLPFGAVLAFSNGTATAVFNLLTQGTDVVRTGANTLSTVAINPGDTVFLIKNGSAQYGLFGISSLQYNPIAVASATAVAHAAQLGQVQSSTSNYAVATGTANAITIALSPALTAYVDGQPLRFKAAATNTGPTTINAGAGAISLVGAVGGLQGGEIVAGAMYEAFYVASSNTAVLVASGGGGLQIAQATGTQQAARYDQLDSYQGTMSITGNVTLTASAFGNILQPPAGNAGGFTVTLPSPTGNQSKRLTIFNSSTGIITVNGTNFNTAFGSAVTSIQLPPATTVTLECDGASYNGVGGAGQIGSDIRPHSISGIPGQIIAIQASNSYALPSGGSWFYSIQIYATGGANQNSNTGIAAGGTTIFNSSGNYCQGFAQRIM